MFNKEYLILWKGVRAMGPTKIILKEKDHFQKFYKIITGQADNVESLTSKEATFLLQRFEERLRSWQKLFENIEAANEEEFKKYSEQWLKFMGCTQKIIYPVDIMFSQFNNSDAINKSGKFIKPISVAIKFYNLLSEVFHRGGVWHSVAQRMFTMAENYSSLLNSLFYHKMIGFNHDVTLSYYGENYKQYHLPISKTLDCLFFCASECMFYAVGGYSYLDNFVIEDGIDSDTYVEGLKLLYKAIDAGLGYFIFSDELIGIVPIPKVKFNNRGQFHCSDGPALKNIWGDEAYFYNEIAVDEKIIKHPEQLSIKEILATKNTQIKEVMIEKYGLEKFIETLGYFVLDEIKVENAVYQLLSVDIEERDPIVVLKVNCPSTAKKYYLRVPPRFKRFKDALAWTFGISSNDLNIYFET